MTEQSNLLIHLKGYYALMPIFFLVLATAILLIVISFKKTQTLSFSISQAALIFSFFSTFFYPDNSINVANLLVFDEYSLFWLRFLLLSSLLINLLMKSSLKERCIKQEEMHVLLLLSISGACTMVLSIHFASFFIGIELMSVPLFAILCYLKEEIKSVESAIKYLVLALVSTSFILLGMALIFIATKSLNLQDFLNISKANIKFFTLGSIFFTLGLCFKLSLVPFHNWAPDVYEGSLAPTCAYLTIVSKSSSLSFLFRFIWSSYSNFNDEIMWILGTIAILSIALGNISSLYQNNIKRLLAYSSIANMGYVILAFFLDPKEGFFVLKVYMICYSISIFLIFSIISILENKPHEDLSINKLQCLSKNHPWFCFVISLALFSLVGLPLTSGLIGKWTLISFLMDKGFISFVLALIILSAIGFYAYLRVIVSMYQKNKPDNVLLSVASPELGSSLILGFLAFLLIFIGIWPNILF